MRDRTAFQHTLPLTDPRNAELERMIEARVAVRAEADAVRWRIRLILVETVMMTSLVAAAGTLLDQPAPQLIRATLMIGATCAGSGLLLVGLSAVTARLLSALSRWRQG